MALKPQDTLLAARLLVEREGACHAQANALTEWLNFGVRYASLVEDKRYGRGMGIG